MAKKIGSKLCERMPQRMADMGLTVEMEQVFREGSFVVIQLQVQHVDVRAVERALREEKSDLHSASERTVSSPLLLERCLKMIGSDNQKALEDEFLPGKVQSKLETKILQVMKEKFERKGLVVDVEILTEARQGRFFYRKLREVRQAARDGA